MPVEVHKFGGTSMGSAERVQRAATLIEAAAAEGGAGQVAVASAMGGVTDELLRAASEAVGGDRSAALAAIEGIRARHAAALDALGGAPGGAAGVDIERVLQEVSDLLEALVLLGELTARTRDRLVSSGEKMSVRLLALALRQRGLDAVAVDADTFLETDDSFGEASPLQVVADRTIAARLTPLLERGAVPVVTGFCGRAPDGATTTLGRGGSDYTATILAAALGASKVTIWTDVDGVFSADPRSVPGARVVEQLHYREAAELSYYGAKVLHQRTMIPVAARGIPVLTRSSFRPEAPGTVVDGRYTPGSHPVKAISAIRGQALLSVEGKGMAGVPGVAARVFGALAARGISVTMISQSSSESSITVAVPEGEVDAAASALKRAFRGALGRGDVEEIAARPGVGLIAAVGIGMAQTPGVAARVFKALADARVNVLAIAQGSSELNVSLAVESSDIDAAVRGLHRAFGLHRRDTGVAQADGMDIMLLGCGVIGRALITLIEERRERVRERFGLTLRVVAVADRSGYLLEPAGLDAGTLKLAMVGKSAGIPLKEQAGGVAGGAADMVAAAAGWRLSRPVLVDVSDAASAGPVFRDALAAGCDVVTANKLPLAGDRAVMTSLMEEAARGRRSLRAEATVGAGLPVIDTVEMLLATGDRLRSAEGCLSGTLGFVMARLEEGEPFSAIVREAAERGYTEPDPVADLSGADVARKAVILSRLSGLDGGVDLPVSLTGLVDTALAGLPRDELYRRLEAYDAPVAEQVSQARAAGCALRYVARVTAEGIAVGPARVPADSALGQLKGSDNMLVFHSERYDERPLVITGPGAGVMVTAMGVLGDILRIAALRSAT